MSSLQIRRQRRMLRGWIKWVPVVAIPFGVLFSHAWLNIQILRADYALQELDTEAKVLQDELHRANSEQTLHQAPDLLAAQADEMAFVPRKPGQREIIYYDPAEFAPVPVERNVAVAQRMPLSPDRPMTSAPSFDGPVRTSSLPRPNVDATPNVPQETSVPSEETTMPEPVTSERGAEVAPSALPEQVVETPVGLAPVQESPPVVLEMPENLYSEELFDIEADMGGLEVL